MRNLVPRFALAAIAACLLSVLPATAHATPAARQVPLRVASYNILHGAGTDGVFDLSRTAAAIRRMDVDVIGLEEVDKHWGARSDWRDETRDLARMLGMRGYFAHIYDLAPPAAGKPDREYGLAILSRYPIVHAENHWITRLSTQEQTPTPKPAPGFPEAVVNVRGALVHVYATHLDYRGDRSVREAQVADTLRIMRKDRPHAQQVLVGDFNAPPDALELAPLWNQVDDALTLVGKRGAVTWPSTDPTTRNDYVTVSPGIDVDAAWVPDSATYQVSSDHLPVVADLTVTRGR